MVRALDQRGARVFRCDAADFPRRLVMTASLGDGGWTGSLHTDRRAVNLREVTAAYFRRPSGHEFPGGMTAAEREWAAAEARFGFGGVLSAVLPWLNHPAAIARAEYKPVQLHEAVRAGLAVPRTLVTNDYAEAARFAAAHAAVVYKSLSGRLIADAGAVKAIYTTPVRVCGAEQEAIAATAHLFQQQVTDKEFDVRVTAVDGDLHAAAIRCASIDGLVDWRRDYNTHEYEVIPVPARVVVGIRGLMQRLGLRFGALDFTVTREGSWLFLEINPNGQWGFIEEATGLPVADSIAAALMRTGDDDAGT